ncbi:hypothetical protein ACFLZ7_01550 [Nanoarchaeota archaeon]
MTPEKPETNLEKARELIKRYVEISSIAGESEQLQDPEEELKYSKQAYDLLDDAIELCPECGDIWYEYRKDIGLRIQQIEETKTNQSFKPGFDREKYNSHVFAARVALNQENLYKALHNYSIARDLLNKQPEDSLSSEQEIELETLSGICKGLQSKIDISVSEMFEERDGKCYLSEKYK